MTKKNKQLTALVLITFIFACTPPEVTLRSPSVDLKSQITSQSAQTSVKRGGALFEQHCAQCHSFTPGDNRRGPNLSRVAGSPVGALAEYKYSSSLAGSEQIWTIEHMDRYLEDPETLYPLSKMLMNEPLNSDERQDIINYLISEPEPAPLSAP